jgi:hypothetical protein
MGEVTGPCRSKGVDTASGDSFCGGLIGSGLGPPSSAPGFGDGCCPIPCSDSGAGGIESSGGPNGRAGGIPFALVPTGNVSTGDVSTADGRTVEGQSAVPGGNVPGGIAPGGIAPGGIVHDLVVGRVTCSSAPASPAAMTKTKRLSKSATNRAKLFSLRGRIHVSALL